MQIHGKVHGKQIIAILEQKEHNDIVYWTGSIDGLDVFVFADPENGSLKICLRDDIDPRVVDGDNFTIYRPKDDGDSNAA